MPACYYYRGQTLVLRLQIPADSRREQIGDCHAGRLRVYLKAEALDGRANCSLLALLAQEFNLPRSALAIRRGQRSRLKSVAIATAGYHPGWLGAIIEDDAK